MPEGTGCRFFGDDSPTSPTVSRRFQGTVHWHLHVPGMLGRPPPETGPAPGEWRGEIRTSCGRWHDDRLHVGPRLGRGSVAQARVQAPPVVEPYAPRPTVPKRPTRRWWRM